jgi:hypothetical protein
MEINIYVNLFTNAEAATYMIESELWHEFEKCYITICKVTKPSEYYTENFRHYGNLAPPRDLCRPDWVCCK